MRGSRLKIVVLTVVVLMAAIATAVCADISLRVYDNGTNSDDDIARVYVDGQNLGLITFFSGGTNQRTFYLNITAAGTHTLVIEHASDVDAVDLCDEHMGTYGIEFGGGGLSAANDSATVSRGTSAEIDVLANDIYVSAAATATDSIPCPSETPFPSPPTCECSDPRTTYSTSFEISEGAGQIFVNRLTSPASKGTAEIISGGTLIRYTSNPDACGVDTFAYEVAGPSGSLDTATVTVTIPTSSPIAVGDTVETEESQALLINVLGNDTGSGLSLDSIGTPANGTAVIVGNGIRYTPTARFEGTDRFPYTARDVCGATATSWVEVHVRHTNHPPTANPGSLYQGTVNEPLVLDASFSNDPDLGDILQYRWDLDGNGTPDTDWSTSAQLTYIFREPHFGQIVLEVRDLYRGQPTGASSQATAFVRIASIQSIQVFVFEDLDANGIMDPGEPGLPGIGLAIGGDTLATQADGGLSVELNAGSWTVAMTPGAVSQLESRGFAITQTETMVTLGISAVETVTLGVVKTSTKLKGLVYADIDGDGAFDEDIDRPLQGLRIILDGDTETLTDDGGRFFFLSVPFGEHILWIGENTESGDGSVIQEPLSLLVSATLDRGVKSEFFFLWPWARTGPDQGFLQIHIEKTGSE